MIIINRPMTQFSSRLHNEVFLDRDKERLCKMRGDIGTGRGYMNIKMKFYMYSARQNYL